MSLVETVFAIAEQEMDRLATQIAGELKDACPKRTGEAANSVGIEKIDQTHIFVGSDNPHFYFADQGNGHRIIYPVKAKALHFSDGTFHNRANPYPGKHFVKEVADRHR